MNRGWYWRLGLVLASLIGVPFVILWPSIRASTPGCAKIPFRLNEGLDIPRRRAPVVDDAGSGQARSGATGRWSDIREQLARDFRIHRGQERPDARRGDAPRREGDARAVGQQPAVHRALPQRRRTCRRSPTSCFSNRGPCGIGIVGLTVTLGIRR